MGAIPVLLSNRVTQRLLDTIAHTRALRNTWTCRCNMRAATSGSMKRGSNGDAFLQLLDRIRKTIPAWRCALSFSSSAFRRTDSDFRELCGFVQRRSLTGWACFLFGR